MQHYNKAKELITSRQFHSWEGGEGKVVGQYLICHLELAKRAIEHGEYQNALEFLTEAETYPVNLGEGKLYGTQENDIFFLKGLAHAKMGNTELSNTYFTKATIGIDEPVQAIFYNDPQPDKIFYQGLGWKHLGDKQKAISIFKKLISFGTKHLNDSISIDYFAVSLPDLLVFESDLDVRNNIHCLYLMGLGNLGLGYENFNKAEQLFEKVLSIDINHQGAVIRKRMIQFLTIAEAEKQDFILK